MKIFRGMKSVGYAWRTVEMSSCQIVVIRCASTALKTGNLNSGQFTPNFLSSQVQNYCCTPCSSLVNKKSPSGNHVFRSARSRSCPFCRNCLNRLSTRDLWILTSDTEIIDSETLAKENLLHFYLYTESLPLFQPDMNIFIPDYML